MGTRRWAWTDSVPGELLDAGAVVLLLLAGALSLVLPTSSERAPGRSVLPLLVVLLLLQTVPLLWRRRWPVAVLAIVVATLTVRLAVLRGGPGVSSLGVALAVYSVAVYAAPLRRLAVGGLALLAALIGLAEYFSVDSSGAIAVPGPVLVAVWLSGDYVRARRMEARERAERAERDRESDRRRAASEERARIARELHDVVAHHLSAIAIQAAAARTVRRTDPQASDRALAEVEAASRQAAGELNRLLGAIRGRDAEGAANERLLTPRPGLAGLDTLVTRARDAGLDIHLEVIGEPRQLPEALDLSAYRILQEALTNVMKHARSSRVEVRVRYGERELQVDVDDDGRGPVEAGSGDGHGLIGMRERVALFGGELATGPRPGGGFAVRARLPLEPAP
jgi:signal transduction histidine kinase